MTLYYITHARMPTEKAHGFQIAKTCEAFGKKGIDVVLVVPKRKNSFGASIYDHYDVEKNFSVVYVSAPHFFWLPIPRLNFYLTSLVFLLRSMFLSIPQEAIVYTRSPEIAWWFSKRRITFFEGHTWPSSGRSIMKKLLRRVSGIITNSKGTAEVFKEQCRVPVTVARNGVDLDLYADMLSREEARRAFNLPQDKTIALYAGRFEEWKGIRTILEAVKQNTDESLMFVLSGGLPEEEEGVRCFLKEHKKEDMVRIIPPQFGKDVPRLLASADIFLLPNAPVHDEAVLHTSPIKSFIYMAAKRPIIASDLPSIREVLHEKNSFLVPPSDPEALLSAIQKIIEEKETAQKKAFVAGEEVSAYTWDARVGTILREIEKQSI